MNAPVPRDNCPQNPVRMFSPIAASENTRNGIMMEVRKKSLAKAGMTANAVMRMAAKPTRSWRIGNSA